MMALSGVRSSWLMVARKRLLAALARSASARASSSACLLLLALGDVAHDRDHLALAGAIVDGLIERAAAHLDPDELRGVEHPMLSRRTRNSTDRLSPREAESASAVR